MQIAATGRAARNPEISGKPFPFVFDHAALGLVVIDMQCDFIKPGVFGAIVGRTARTGTVLVALDA